MAAGSRTKAGLLQAALLQRGVEVGIFGLQVIMTFILVAVIPRLSLSVCGNTRQQRGHRT